MPLLLLFPYLIILSLTCLSHLLNLPVYPLYDLHSLCHLLFKPIILRLAPCLRIAVPIRQTPIIIAGSSLMCSSCTCCSLMHWLILGSGSSHILSYQLLDFLRVIAIRTVDVLVLQLKLLLLWLKDHLGTLEVTGREDVVHGTLGIL